MRALIAFDKFKDALSARDAGSIAEQALRERHPDWEIDVCALSDGGDGFEDVLGSAAQGKRTALQVTGPRGGLVEAGITAVPISRIQPAALARLSLAPGAGPDSTVVLVEMATASGLALLPAAQRTPWHTTTFGTGQLIRAAAELGCAAIVVGVGGSATHDLGLGALSALGLRLRDKQGASVRPPVPDQWENITGIEGELLAGLPPIHVACDVTSPLLGPQGAACVFAPQKGLRPEELPALEDASERMANLLCAHFHQPPTLPHAPGTGAAGGIAFGLMCAARAQLLPGFAFVSDWLDLDRRLAAADVVITGEGRFDATSSTGKGPGALVARGTALGKDVHVFAGQVTAQRGNSAAHFHEITPTDVPLNRALAEARSFLAGAVRQHF